MESYLQDFDPAQPFEPDVLRVEAGSHVEQARALLAEAELTLHCHPGGNDQSWALWLVGETPELPGIVQATAWPVTVSDGLGCSLLDPADGNKEHSVSFQSRQLPG
jgi:hypothetical protein